MANSRKRLWRRWVSVGEYSLERLVWIARHNGMECVAGFKPSWCIWNHIALRGTAEQMRRTEAEWGIPRLDGADEWPSHDVTSRQPKGAFRISKLPREKWAEHELPAAEGGPQGTSLTEERAAEAAGG